MSLSFDAILLVSFGGPEGPDDVLPFLRNVARGKNISEARLREVAEHYFHFGGRSPINDYCRALRRSLKEELDRRGHRLPIYWGNRNWYPFLEDAIQELSRDGIRRALAVILSVFGSYPSCRRYLEELEAARRACGTGAPQVERLKLAAAHPGFIVAMTDRVLVAREAARKAGFEDTQLIFTAHSLPSSMAANAPYVRQFEEASRLVAQAAGFSEWQLAYQSRSGPPHVPWLEPDILDVLRAVKENGKKSAVLIVPIGFLSDHVEVLYDLDVEAAGLAKTLGIAYFRAATVGTHPAFVRGLCDVIEERVSDSRRCQDLPQLVPCPDECPADCCIPT